MGKGSKPRPILNKEKFSDNWDTIFKAKESIPKDAESVCKSKDRKGS
jgi:hypothetical protein